MQQAKWMGSAATAEGQLEILDRSLWYILLTIGAVGFSFWSVVLQRRLLAGELAGRQTEAERQIFWLRGASASIILWVSSYFYSITKNAAQQTSAAGQTSGDLQESLGTVTSFLILAVSALRVLDLLWGGLPTAERGGAQNEPL